MKTRASLPIIVLVMAGMIVSVLSPAVAEEIPLNKLYKSLADKNHYPVAEDLTSAQADVKCNIFDQVLAAFPDAAAKPVTVKFFWARPSPQAAPQQKFAAVGMPDGVADLAKRFDLVFQPVTEFVIPSPIYWTFDQTAAKATSEGGKITVAGDAKSPQGPIKKLTAEIDATSYQVSKMQLDLGQAQIGFEMTGKDLGGKLGIETETITYPQFKRVLKFEYAQVDKYWLPSKLTLDNLGTDGKQLEPTYVFEFSNWQVNKGVPDGTF